ncbi:hypothetical protein [Actinoplanes derwentensis]|uniref:Uncharacterized protein n=1 Tax=Actinoplanes derwentensis TaxID=113562 RepID=A0A1H1ZTU3_9ACTN|nr:hypothetical protein [Actinoplanes derwentensis]GID83564.1 hypothetical protein Ade03nite_24880 [Actinoplanes derwentensis]SDT36812.1 hypothetical protein SAMN04489716_3480 [Actinoplanes derwentensis]
MSGFALDDPKYLQASDLDGVLRAVLEVASELWVLKDRFAVLEQVMAERGYVTPEDLDRTEPTVDTEARLAAERTAFTARIIGSVAGADPA